MKALNSKMGYETPCVWEIQLVIGEVILQGSVDSDEIEDTEPTDGYWK